MEHPVNTTQLAQIVYVCQWIGNTLPEFSKYREYFETIKGSLNIFKTKLNRKRK